MTDFTSLLQQGNAWLYIPSAVLLGALHGLEPGHSKTMMAAFIVAIRGTVMQAVLLGLAATASHTAVVWVIALGGMYFGQRWSAETSEPYLLVASAVLIIGTALWMLWRTHRDVTGKEPHGDGHGHGHDHGHHHHHHDEVRRIDTGHGVARLEVFEDGVPPRFRLRRERGPLWPAAHVRIETLRPGGERQVFSFVACDGFLESADEIPEPHEFTARLRLGDQHHAHEFDVKFVEHAHHGHGLEGVAQAAKASGDAHARAHADDIRRRFAGRSVTTGQLLMFGLTGGLIPCPASITVLLLCLQLKQISLGAALVLCFSVGLALTMVMSGALAALGVRHLSHRWSGFGDWTRRAPYVSAVLIMAVGLYMGWQGWTHLPGAAA